MYPAQSIIDDRAVDPHAAQAALDRLRRRIRESARCAVWAVVAAAALFALDQRTLVLPLLLGALAGAIVSALARSDRQALLVRLVGQRSAYAIPEVARAAESLATPAVRRELARRVVRLVLEADGLEPRNPMGHALPDRVSARADDLLSVAYLLAQDGVRVHPATMALLNRLLSSPARSPLFNPQVPEQHLAMALQRVRCSMDS